MRGRFRWEDFKGIAPMEPNLPPGFLAYFMLLAKALWRRTTEYYAKPEKRT